MNNKNYYVCAATGVILGSIAKDGRTTVSRLSHKQVVARYPHAEIMSSTDATKAAVSAMVSKTKTKISEEDYKKIRTSGARKTYDTDAMNQETIKLLDTIVDDVTTVYAKTRDGYFKFTDRLQVPHRALLQKVVNMPIQLN